jgi:hypothetical protein
MMKIIPLIALLILAGCGGDEDSSNTANPDIVSLWRAVDGDEFSYLLLLDDETFLYAENDLSAESNGENGLEVGTYSHDAEKRSLTFNISYDDNSPNNDSGVGDIGSPVTLSAEASEEKLSLAGLSLSPVSFFQGDIAGVTGVWSFVDGDEFQYLALLDDSTFFYAENDPEATGAENGLEVGVYSMNEGVNENSFTITFGITYDDNDPLNDSGVGDTDEDAIVEVVLSNDGKTLTLGGELVLEKRM